MAKAKVKAQRESKAGTSKPRRLDSVAEGGDDVDLDDDEDMDDAPPVTPRKGGKAPGRPFATSGR